MGRIAEAMMEGELCDACGVPMDGQGRPQTCADCASVLDQMAQEMEIIFQGCEV